MAETDIAIIGMSCVFPGASNLRKFWANLANGVDAIRDVPPDRWVGTNGVKISSDHEAYLACMRGGFLESEHLFDPLPFAVMPNTVRYGDADQFLMLQVIDEALRDAQVANGDPLRERTDVIVGRGAYPGYKQVELNLRAETIERVLELIDRKFPEAFHGAGRDAIDRYLRSSLSPNEADLVATSIPNITASRAANRLNLGGTAFTVDAACASSLIALEQAVWRLRRHQSDLAVAAGIFLANTPTFAHVFTRLGALSPSGTIRPFDRNADGLVIGEGCGAVILKRLEDACRDEDPIYAVVKGVGSSSDGSDVDVLAPSSAGQIKALQRAYGDAGIDPATVGYLEAHGTGTVVGDRTEMQTIKSFFGTSREPATQRAMGSVKSMIGHTMPASGMASLIKTALSLSNKTIPPNLNCEQPHPALADAPFYLVTETRPWVHDSSTNPRRASINTFGFGGANVHVVLEEALPSQVNSSARVVVPRNIESAVRRASELAVFTAGFPRQLAGQLRRLRSFLDPHDAKQTLADVAWTLSLKADLSRPCKLALICEDLEQLQQLIEVCLPSLDADHATLVEHESIYYSAAANQTRGKVACLFPGMGFPGLTGNYPEHLMEICLHFPEARQEFDFFEGRDRHPEDRVPTSVIFSPPATLPELFRKQLKRRLAIPNTNQDLPDQNIPEERYLSAMGVTLANWATWEVFRKFNVPVDMLAGQSQGEMAALCAGGSCDFHETAPFYWKTLNVDMQYKKGEGLAFVYLNEEQLEPLLKDYPGTHICIHVTPDSVVIAGEEEMIEQLAERLRRESILVHMMPYPPIHTPRLSGVREGLNEALQHEQLRMRKPEIDVYSSIQAEKYPGDEEQIREIFSMNIDHPVRMWQTIRKLYDDGARVFVQIGGGHIASHVKTLLPDGTDIVTAAFDIDTRNPLTQLNHLCATLFTAGVSISFAPLFERRALRQLDFEGPQPTVKPPQTAIALRLDWSPLTHKQIPSMRSAAAVANRNDSQQSQTGSSPQREGETGMPMLGQIRQLIGEREVVIDRKLDLAEDRFLGDHCLAEARAVKPVEGCLPTLPMTMSMELMAESAALLCPGLGLIGFEEVRASNWITLRDRSESDLRIEARVLSVDSECDIRRVHVDVYFEDKLSSSSKVLFSRSYPQSIGFGVAETDDSQQWPWLAEDIYCTKRMFHGPLFQCITRLDNFGNPSFTAALEVLPKDHLFRSFSAPLLLTDPCVMDGIGQLVGLWCMAFNWTVFPMGVEKVEVFCPTPPVGTTVAVRGEVIEFDLELKRIRVNIDVEDGRGSVWMRVAGWSDWIFDWPSTQQEWLRTPDRRYGAEELALPGLPEKSLCAAVRPTSLKNGSLERTSRVLLNSNELDEYNGITDHNRQRQFLASRLAAKDAVRLWQERYARKERQHPAGLQVGHDINGRPHLLEAGQPIPLQISIAHTKSSAVALVSEFAVGIDVESIDANASSILADFATSDEISLIETVSANQPDNSWAVRLWCAKEAVGKLLGTGIQGRPKEFQALDANESGELLVLHVPTTQKFIVTTVRLTNSIVAYTGAQNAVIEPAISTRQ